jgi:hypothetical protein
MVFLSGNGLFCQLKNLSRTALNFLLMVLGTIPILGDMKSLKGRLSELAG